MFLISPIVNATSRIGVTAALAIIYSVSAQAYSEQITIDSVTTFSRELIDPSSGFSPEFDLKTNLLEDAVGTMSIGGEVKLSRRSSLDIQLLWNPWKFKDETMYKQWRVSPEIRWWPAQSKAWDNRTSALQGHFLGLHIIGGEYNYSNVRLPFNAFPDLKNYRFEGWFLGGGISYGYRYNISHRFAMEAELGLGVAHVAYHKYACGHCGEHLGKGSRLYVGPTRAALNLILRIGKNPRMPLPQTVMEHERTVITRTIERERTDTIYLAAATQQRAEIKNLKSASYALRLQYPLSSSEIIEDLGNNRHQIEGLREFIDSYVDNPEVKIASIDIEGWASLEGDSANNLRLSDERSASAALMIAEMFPNLTDLIHAQGMGEDWISPRFEGKEKLLLTSNLDERERQLRLLDNGKVFKRLLKTTFPANRRIECTIRYTEME